MTGAADSSRIFFQHGPAIHNGQHDVQQHQVRLEGAEILHTLSAVLGYFGLKPLLLQIEMEQLCDITVILYNKHLLGHGETLHFFIGGPGGRFCPSHPDLLLYYRRDPRVWGE